MQINQSCKCLQDVNLKEYGATGHCSGRGLVRWSSNTAWQPSAFQTRVRKGAFSRQCQASFMSIIITWWILSLSRISKVTVCCQLSCTDFDAWQPIYKKFEFCCHFLTQGSQGTPSHHIWLLPWWHWASPRYSACPRTPPGQAAQVYYCFPSSYFLNWASLTQHPSTFPNAT